jgi:hypothetical protein
MLAAASIDPRRMWRVTCDVLLAFFGTHLQQEPARPLLDGPSDGYPELRYGAPWAGRAGDPLGGAGAEASVSPQHTRLVQTVMTGQQANEQAALEDRLRGAGVDPEVRYIP